MRRKTAIKSSLVSVTAPCSLNGILREFWEETNTVKIISVAPHGMTEQGMFNYLITYEEKIK